MTFKPFKFWGFRTPRALVDETLGPLERRVLELMWGAADALSVREVVDRLGSPVAYTTAMTTLDRLYKKGLLGREKAGRAFVYRVAISREDLDRRVAGEVLQGVLDGSHAALPLLSTLVDAVSDRDARLLDDLERLVREKRRALAREGE